MVKQAIKCRHSSSRSIALCQGFLWRFVLGLAALLCWSEPAALQPLTSHETGRAFLKNYNYKDYGTDVQSWSIAQDDHGLMYFGRSAGHILQFDGESWSGIFVPEGVVIRSMLRDQSGRIYVGARGTFGFLQPDSAGAMQYRSLLEHVPEHERQFRDVWSMATTSEGVFFQTTTHLFRWAKGKIDIWKPAGKYGRVFAIQDTIYVQDAPTGLLRLSADRFKVESEEESFANYLIQFALPLGAGRILTASYTAGASVYDGSSISPFSPSLHTYLKQQRVYSGAHLPDGSIALGTTSEGLFILDRHGRLVRSINKNVGLRDEKVAAIFPDREGGTWLAHNSGISRVEIPSPLSVYDDENGLEGIIQSIARHHNELYVATTSGAFQLVRPTLKSDKLSHSVFKPISQQDQFWFLLPAGEHLFAVSFRGLHLIRDDKVIQIWENQGMYSIHLDERDPTHLFVGGRAGLWELQIAGSDVQAVNHVPGIQEEIREILPGKDGWIWLGLRGGGLMHLNTSDEGEQPQIRRFGIEHGLPPVRVKPMALNDDVVFMTSAGLFRYLKNQDRFILDSEFGNAFREKVVQDHHGKFWGDAADGHGLLSAILQQDGAYRWDTLPLSRFENFTLRTVYAETGENDGVLWFGGRGGLIRYDSRVKKNYKVDYSAMVRRVIVNNDSTFFSGISMAGQDDARIFMLPDLAYAQNSLRFEFAAPTFDHDASKQYQYFLEGFEKDWSAWQDEARKDYTNLPEGGYTFRVRAKNVYEHLSREGAIAFTILPPWYRVWWAYATYLLLGLVAVFIVVKSRVSYLENKTRQLEAIVAERTQKVVEQKNQLQEQSARLQELDQQKSRFFANISHEFRTPLTLILGPLEQMAEEEPREGWKQKVDVMYRNGKRMLALINQLLDLARLEAGSMKMHAARGDIAGFIKGIVMSFASLAERKKIDLQLECAHEAIEFVFDADKIEKIFYNLLSNAFKFTPKDGAIHVTVAPLNMEEPKRLEVTITDTGMGIPAERLPNIFDRFYQADSSLKREHEGAGIGLALVRELLAMHGGSIAVQSTENEGTAFKVMLSSLEAIESTEEVAEYRLTPSAVQEALSLPSRDETPQTSEEALPQDNQHEADIILVVEDHPDVCRYVREYLEPIYKVLEAHDGAEGLAVAEDVIPNLIISDVMMPKMDGYELCKALKTNEKTSHVPVILLTAKAGDADKIEGLETGADDYLTKPFNSKELLVRVKNLLELRRKLRERFSQPVVLKPSEVAVNSTDQQFLQRAMDAVENHIDDDAFNVETLCRQVSMEQRQLHRKLKALINQSPTNFIRSLRLQRAMQMLQQNAGTVSEIAFACGFNNLSYFSRSFRERFGKLPSEFAGGNNPLTATRSHIISQGKSQR